MRKVTSHLSRDMRATLDDEFIVMDDMDDNGDYDNSDSICNINDIHINNSVNRDGDAESDVRELENTTHHKTVLHNIDSISGPLSNYEVNEELHTEIVDIIYLDVVILFTKSFAHNGSTQSAYSIQ
ncbi:hypothetical protein M8J76_000090 [Diaphorina citri]|nr:hypothetical protein M8J76_000090 [Diaphorina citri]KAI5754501.1 hypothetical protein M8J77_009047 [Diaphorina citri]